MSKFFNKWTRTIHRWLALPTAILIPVFVVVRFAGKPEWQAVLKQYEMVQSLLMLALAITGAYLYLLPYLAKRKRNNRRKEK